MSLIQTSIWTKKKWFLRPFGRWRGDNDYIETKEHTRTAGNQMELDTRCVCFGSIQIGCSNKQQAYAALHSDLDLLYIFLFMLINDESKWLNYERETNSTGRLSKFLVCSTKAIVHIGKIPSTAISSANYADDLLNSVQCTLISLTQLSYVAENGLITKIHSSQMLHSMSMFERNRKVTLSKEANAIDNDIVYNGSLLFSI